MATLTASGINCSNGTLDGQYTGSSGTNTSFPIGSYISFAIANPYAPAPTAQTLNNSRTLYVITGGIAGYAGKQFVYGTSSSGSVSITALSGTWVLRGGNAFDGCVGTMVPTYGLWQRLA